MISKRADSIVESYKTYSSRKITTAPYYLSKKQYKDILIAFMKKFVFRLITTGDRIILPGTIGSFQAIKFRNKDFKPKDFGTTRKLKTEDRAKNIRHINRATEGYWTTIHWYKLPSRDQRYGARFKHARNYAMKLTRPNIRPNSYNKNNPEVSLYPFFKDKGWQIYKEI